ncbi:MAG TPA: hypothetical protein QGF58_18100 [Myxococcota bacterium]|nr:hypothetical protein [Myxococcota bacterium]
MRCLVVRDGPDAEGVGWRLGLIPSAPFSPAEIWRRGPHHPGLRVFSDPPPSSLLARPCLPHTDPALVEAEEALGIALRLWLPSENEAWVALRRAGEGLRFIQIRGDEVLHACTREPRNLQGPECRMEALRLGLCWLLGEPLLLEADELLSLPEVLTARA